MSLLIYTSSLFFFQSVAAESRVAYRQAARLKAHYYARSALETGIVMLKTIPIKYLYQFNMIPSTPVIPLGEGAINIEIREETGKLNLNHLVNPFNDEMNLKSVERLQRLFQYFSLSTGSVDAIIDWIDKNNTRMPSGHEAQDYATINPPRKIKNGWMHSLQELLFIPEFSADLLYNDHRSEAEKKMYSTDFLTDEEKSLVTEEDYILANSLTTALCSHTLDDRRLNLNSAGYHALLSLSPYMTPAIVKAILLKRQKNGGYFNSLQEVKDITQLHLPIKEGVTLYDWIESEIVVQDRLFLLTAVGRYHDAEVHIEGLYDIQGRKLSMYRE